MTKSTTVLNPDVISFALAQTQEHYVQEMCAGPFQLDLLTKNLIAVGFELAEAAGDPGAFLEDFLCCIRDRNAIQQHPDFVAFQTYVRQFWDTLRGPFHFIRSVEEEDVMDIVRELATGTGVGKGVAPDNPTRHLAVQIVAMTLAVSEAGTVDANLRGDFEDVLRVAEDEVDPGEIKGIEQDILPDGI